MGILTKIISQLKRQNSAGQHALEYVILVILVIAGIITMGRYVIRSWNATMKGYEVSARDSMEDPLLEAPPIVFAGCSSDAQCSNGDPCDGVETCSGGNCFPAASAPSATNCQGSWGPFGACNIATCLETSTYTITINEQCGGTACPFADGDTQTQPCPTCPGCPALSGAPAGACGTLNFPSQTSNGNYTVACSTAVPGGAGCTGSVTYNCTDGSWTYVSGSCVQPCIGCIDKGGVCCLWMDPNDPRWDVQIHGICAGVSCDCTPTLPGRSDFYCTSNDGLTRCLNECFCGLPSDRCQMN